MDPPCLDDLDGQLLGVCEDLAGAGGESAESLLRVEDDGVGLVHEPLLGGLFRDSQALADVGPGGARSAGLVNEVSDQMIGKVVEVVGGQHGVGEPVERVIVDLFDRFDQVVESDGGVMRQR
ncbi:MAG: hypothetical protein JXA67_20560 [Micromonosporaceae bacterium]|nr:hypothetical protein [Micromonosporaceae bacterium]